MLADWLERFSKHAIRLTWKVILGATKLAAHDESLAVVDWVELNWIPVLRFCALGTPVDW